MSKDYIGLHHLKRWSAEKGEFIIQRPYHCQNLYYLNFTIHEHSHILITAYEEVDIIPDNIKFRPKDQYDYFYLSEDEEYLYWNASPPEERLSRNKNRTYKYKKVNLDNLIYWTCLEGYKTNFYKSCSDYIEDELCDHDCFESHETAIELIQNIFNFIYFIKKNIMKEYTLDDINIILGLFKFIKKQILKDINQRSLMEYLEEKS